MRFQEVSFIGATGNLYKIYAVSKRNAATVRKQLRQLLSVDNKSIETKDIDIPTDKNGLCGFLNKDNPFITEDTIK